jgi:membrane protein DedA with SNARE-associated domain
LISLPAGLSRMNLKDFILYTVVGSTLWNIILAALGFFLYTRKELLEKYYTELTWVMIILGVGFVGYLIYKFLKKHE